MRTHVLYTSLFLLLATALTPHTLHAAWPFSDDTQEESADTSSIPQSAPEQKSFNLFGGSESGSVSANAIKQYLDAAEKGDVAAIDGAKQAFGAKSAAAALTEWMYLRRAGAPNSGARALSFVRDNPDWPESTSLNRMAEQSFFSSEPSAALAYFQNRKPLTGSGKLALARAYAAKGDIGSAQALIHEAWTSEPLPGDIEKNFVAAHARLIQGPDMRARMEHFFFKGDIVTATRAADYMGGDAMAYARARAAVIRKAGNAGALLGTVPEAWQGEPGYLFAKAQYLRRNDKVREAANTILQIPKNAHARANADETWEERRVIARQLIDQNDYQLAYQISRDHNATTDIQQMEGEFHAGWIALSFLNDANRADKHFATLEGIAKRPISLSRASYWRARTAEQMGNNGQAEHHYKNAAQFPTTYYGQLARARLGSDQLGLPSSPHASSSDKQAIQNSRIYQAILLLGKADRPELMNQFVKDFSGKLGSTGHLAALGELLDEDGTSKHGVLVGKSAAQKGIILTKIAFPIDGIPAFETSGPGVEKAVVYAISRQESEFDPKIRSSAGAVGLMQMLPSTAAQTARKFGVAWQPGRLTEGGYNASLGSTHLGELINNYNGSYILTFAAYNAGPGRVREWIQKYGDPRDGKTDPIDWVERIPFSETRNYVQRVMENVQVYRARLGGGNTTALLIEKDLMRGAGRSSGTGAPSQKGFWE